MYDINYSGNAGAPAGQRTRCPGAHVIMINSKQSQHAVRRSRTNTTTHTRELLQWSSCSADNRTRVCTRWHSGGAIVRPVDTETLRPVCCSDSANLCDGSIGAFISERTNNGGSIISRPLLQQPNQHARARAPRAPPPGLSSTPRLTGTHGKHTRQRQPTCHRDTGKMGFRINRPMVI